MIPRATSFLCFLLVLAALATTGCGGHKSYWRADAASVANGSTIVIQPMQTYAAGRRLYVRATVINRGAAPIRVIRDAVSATLPNGQLVGRSTGITSLHGGYVIPPGGAHAVYVDFMAEGWEWEGIPYVIVNWAPAITSVYAAGPGNVTTDVPPMVLRGSLAAAL